MGRTKRRRMRRRNDNLSLSLNSNLEVINLRTWMTNKGWENQTKLQLKEFPETGRGLSSTKSIQSYDVIIKIPFRLLITYQTILESELMNILTAPQLKIHDYLSLFLIFEKHKEDESLWKEYINSLPSSSPDLPWLCSLGEYELFPEEMREATLKRRSDFISSWSRVKQSIIPCRRCIHCKKPLDCVIHEDIFKWAYVLVNTRAVYVDPQAATKVYGAKIDKLYDSKGNCLSDEPSVALCPYLDMFNHSYATKTDADVVCDQGRYFYQLRTHTNYKKHEQIFISYGSHDNMKLLMEYGFYIPGNYLDSVCFEFKEVLDVLKIKLDQRQYRYINEHNFTSDLFVNRSGVSFNLKSILFVGKNCDIRNYNQYIYCDLDNNFKISSYCDDIKNLLTHKLECKRTCSKKFEEKCEKCSRSELILSFLNYDLKFIELCLLDFSTVR